MKYVQEPCFVQLPFLHTLKKKSCGLPVVGPWFTKAFWNKPVLETPVRKVVTFSQVMNILAQSVDKLSKQKSILILLYMYIAAEESRTKILSETDH